MLDLERQLQEIVKRDNVLKNEPMSKHTSLKIGGIADYFIKVKSVDELKNILELTNRNKIKTTIVGNGTNLLVKDAGIRGVVIKLELNEFKIKKTANEILITVGSGMTLAALAAIALKEEISGLEFLAGIPGTIGGAIRMNAGAYGSEMKDIVVKTRYMTYDGKIKTLDLDEHEFMYRNSIFSKLNVFIIDTTIRVKKGNKEEIESKMNEYSMSRKKSQPLEYPNAGSTFKRKEGIITAKLIDECGLKGFNVGDAEVSTKHAGFIVNKGKATAKDFLELVEYIKKEIKNKTGLDIELEILVIGEDK
ncbi:MAG: UDP-N-acetylmuramate dehydrogenase [Clostridia bacterium]|nr:UDP-N-acetylmuramate dehydrogenase [Clostridia bacterium]